MFEHIPLIFYALTGLINGIFAAVLGLFVYLKDKKEPINKSFGFFCLSAAVWSFGYFLWQISNNAEEALFWSRELMVGAIFIPSTFFHFIVTFLDEKQNNKKLIIIAYLFSSFFFIINFTKFFVERVETKLVFPFWPDPGPFYLSFLFIFFLFVIYSCYLLFKNYEKSTGIKRQQIKYIIIGTLFSFIGGSTNYFLWYGLPILPIGNIVAVTFIIFIAYAIFKHHLFDIKVIATELFAAILLIVLFFNAIGSEGSVRLGLNVFIFITGCIFGILLIRSVLKEVATRKKLAIAYEELKRIDIAKSEFMSMASHQLRTPLTSIKGYVSMLLEGDYGKVEEKHRKALNNVFQSSERLIKIVNDLLDVSRIELGKMELAKEKIKIEDLVLSSIEEMKRLKLVLKKPDFPIPELLADSLKIRQVILNLIDNAVRYTDQGTVEVGFLKKPNSIIIFISDTGDGLSNDEEKNIFSGFTRGSAGINLFVEGAGLGLYVAKKYLDLHRGRVWAESAGKGKGSTFYVELPIY